MDESNMARAIRRVSADSAVFLRPVVASLAGVVGRALLVVCASVAGLLLFDALLDGLEWVFTRDRRASGDAMSSLLGGTASLALVVGATHAREKLRRALGWGEGGAAKSTPGPFARPAHPLNRPGPLLPGDERRPALVVSRDDRRRADLVVCITPAPRAGRDVAPIAPALGTGLKIPSVVRPGKLANPRSGPPPRRVR